MIKSVAKNSNFLSRISEQYNLLIFISLFVALIVRLVLLPIRWINPDEGAHLMDARLLLEGFMPIVDFGSRQPLYVFVLAVFLKLFGVSYKIGRLVPIGASIGTGLVIYLIGAKIYSKKVGLLASVLYLFLPLVIIWSVVVKTEPLAIFLTCMSIYFVVRSQVGKIRTSGWLIIAGIFAGLAYYVRQPAIAAAAAVIIFLLYKNITKPRSAASEVLFFIIGFISTCLAIWAFYLGKMQPTELLLSQLNPLNVLYNRLMHLLGLLPEVQRVVDTQGYRILDQKLDQTITIWRQTFFVTSVLILGAGAYIYSGVRSKHKFSDNNSSLGHLLILWAACVLLIYILQSVNRGFFSQYFTEALPPLCLMAAAFLHKIFQSLKTTTSAAYVLLAFMGGFYFIFLCQHLLWYLYPGVGAYILLAPLVVVMLAIHIFSLRQSRVALLLSVLAASIIAWFIFLLLQIINIGEFWGFIGSQIVFALSLIGSRRRWLIAIHSDWHAVVVMLLAGTFAFITAGYSGWLIGPKYDSVWSPKTVKKVVQILKANGQPGDSVLSGGMIWQFGSGLDTFLNVSHPTEFLKIKYQSFEIDFNQHQPRFIIEDGYTERKYSRYSQFISKELKERYKLIANLRGSRYPVRVFELQNSKQPKEDNIIEFTSSKQ